MDKTLKQTCTAWLVAGSLGWMPLSVSAETIINFDFGRTDSAFSASDGAQLTTVAGWNNVTSTDNALAGNTSQIADLVDSTGAATGIKVDFTYVGAASVAGDGADYSGPYPAAVASLPLTALSDSFFTNNSGQATMTLSGLDDGMVYDFLFYGARGNNDSMATYAVTGSGDTVEVTIDAVFENASSAPTILGVSPDNEGEITVVIGGGTNPRVALNVLQITERVPEPGSLALLALGGVLIARRRR
ncbi:MAG: PEP-CTERM sorting domain-containing protein [Planctomycetota bacterium]